MITRANVDKKTENQRTKEHDSDFKRTTERIQENDGQQNVNSRTREQGDNIIRGLDDKITKEARG